MAEKIPFVYFSAYKAKKISEKTSLFYNISKPFIASSKEMLKLTNLKLKDKEFGTLIVLNWILWSFVISIILTPLLFVLNTYNLINTLLIGIGSGLGIGFMIFIVTSRYPTIIANKKAELIERNLVFALKDILLQISAGKSLYDAIVAISKSNYGEISEEFKIAVKEIQSGKTVEESLENMALRNNSEFLKRTLWQIVNVLKSGSNLKVSLRIIINDLVIEQREKIKNYSQELNMWSLLFMLFAVAIPTIGSTFMLILSSFSGESVTPTTFITFGIVCLIIQYILIGLIHSRRPAINF